MKNVNIKKLLIRLLVYCAGLFILALGVSVSVKSNLGVSPVNSIPYVLSRVTGVDQGLLTTLVFSLYVLAQIVILRREFKIINLFQIVFASLFGYFVTFSNQLIAFIAAPENYFVRLVFLVASMLFIAFGMSLYLWADILPQPTEGLILAIGKKTNEEFGKLKRIFDCCSVAVACLIGFIAQGALVGVREGTVLSAIFIGLIIGIMKKYIFQKLPLSNEI